MTRIFHDEGGILLVRLHLEGSLRTHVRDETDGRRVVNCTGFPDLRPWRRVQ